MRFTAWHAFLFSLVALCHLMARHERDGEEATAGRYDEVKFIHTEESIRHEDPML
jgi:hypothetical protein